MKNLMLILAFLLSAIQTFSQELYEQNGKRGYKDKEGNVIVPAVYSDCRHAGEDMYYGSIEENKYCVINEKGERVTDFIFNNPGLVWKSDFSEGIAGFQLKDEEGEKFAGYVTREGKILYTLNTPDHTHLRIYPFQNGIGLIGLQRYRWLDFFETADVPGDNYYVFVNSSGEAMFSVSEVADIRNFVNGFAAIAFFNDNGDKLWAFSNLQGEWIANGFSKANNFQEGLAAVAIIDENSGKETWGFIDSQGEWMGYGCSSVSNFKEGVAAVAIIDENSGQELWGYINSLNEWVVEPKYHYASSFRNGFAWVDLGEYEYKNDYSKNIRTKYVIRYRLNSKGEIVETQTQFAGQEAIDKSKIDYEDDYEEYY